MSKSLLNPFNLKERENTDNIEKAIHDLQIDDIVRNVFVDVSKQKRMLDILINLCTDKDTILYRQSVLRDFMYNRNLYYQIMKISNDLDKCFQDYNALVSSRLKVKSKSEISLTDSQMSLKDYAISIEVLTKIYDRLNEIFINYGPASDGLKEIQSKVYNRVKVKEYQDLKDTLKAIQSVAFGFNYSVNLDDKLYPQDIKYILCNGKYTGEKFTLFKKKEESGRIDVIDKVTADFKSIGLEAFNRVVVVLEDIFETMYEDIAYLSREFIFFEFGVTVYDMLGERRIDCLFPSVGATTEYKNTKDIFLAMKYIKEGYSGKIYGNDITIKDEVSTLVVGANNTGKTVFLRTIGINQIFGQSGLFIPADYAQISIKEDLATIFSGEEKDTDVGGRFEKEVIDIKEIIDVVNSKSLVIINEIFQSTFANDGKNALFDILNYFTEINVSWICVTHLTGILDERNDFIKPVKCLETMGEKENYKIKEI